MLHSLSSSSHTEKSSSGTYGKACNFSSPKAQAYIQFRFDCECNSIEKREAKKLSETIRFNQNKTLQSGDLVICKLNETLTLNKL